MLYSAICIPTLVSASSEWTIHSVTVSLKKHQIWTFCLEVLFLAAVASICVRTILLRMEVCPTHHHTEPCSKCAQENTSPGQLAKNTITRARSAPLESSQFLWMSECVCVCVCVCVSGVFEMKVQQIKTDLHWIVAGIVVCVQHFVLSWRKVDLPCYRVACRRQTTTTKIMQFSATLWCFLQNISARAQGLILEPTKSGSVTSYWRQKPPELKAEQNKIVMKDESTNLLASWR